MSSSSGSSSSEFSSLCVPPLKPESSYESSGILDLFLEYQAQSHAEDTATSNRRYIHRDREEADEALWSQYFAPEPKFPDYVFRQCFRMSKWLFSKIVDEVTEEEDWFKESVDATGRRSFSLLQKCTAAIRQLAYGNVPDTYDESLAMAKRTARECLDYFYKVVIRLYSKEFLHRPTSHDIALIKQAHEESHNFPGMLGSLDCTHWAWRDCPLALRGQYHRGDHEVPIVILEAVCSIDLWFWHAYFGCPGSLNDINVLNQSSLFKNDSLGTEPTSDFTLNGHVYRRGYYLVDGIYPAWSPLVKQYNHATELHKKQLDKIHSAARKDVERAFGVLKSKWAIVGWSARSTNKGRLVLIMYTCIILHNMVIKDEGNAISPVYIADPPSDPIVHENYGRLLRDNDKHYELHADLVEHICSLNLDIPVDDC